jgi:hypothetical protein
MATLKLTADDERQLLAEKPALKQIYDTQVRRYPYSWGGGLDRGEDGCWSQLAAAGG